MSLDQTGNRLAASTAETTAALRALGGHDPLAARFVPRAPKLTALVHVPGVRRGLPRVFDRMAPGVFGYEQARLAEMDALVTAELRAGARQLLVLGAGYDSRVHRLALSGVACFECDHPVTARRKRALVRRAFGDLPAHVTYVDADLEREDLAAALGAAGYDPDRRSVILWSGVSPYVDQGAVASVLRFAASHAPGSALIFDYVHREVIDGDDEPYGARELLRRVADLGEPMRFGIRRDTAGEFLAAYGLALELERTPADLDRLHLTGTRYRCFDCGGIVLGRVPCP